MKNHLRLGKDVRLTVLDTKNFPFAERYGVQFRAEFFNFFNHANFQITNMTFGTAPFGIYDTTYGNPRIVQLSLQFHF